MNDDDEKWYVSGSDEDCDGPPDKPDYSPPPKEIIKLYESLDSNGQLTIKWSWPYGRRQPINSCSAIEEEDEELLETSRPEEKSDFDFEDEASTPVLRKEKQSGPKGSAKKKTTSLSGVLSNMRRFRQLEKEQSLQNRTKR